MKTRWKILAVLLILQLCGCKNDDPEPVNAELTGQWERVDGNNTPLNGMQLEFSSGQGVVTKSPETASDFMVGDVKWKGVTKSAEGVYSLQDRASDGSYIPSRIFILTDGKELILSGQTSNAGSYQKWKRL